MTFKEAVEARDFDTAVECLAPDVTFNSPVAHTPFEGKEVVAGVIVKEVHPRHVLLSEGGVMKRIDLPSDAGVSSGPAAPPGQASPSPSQSAPPLPPPPPLATQSPPQPLVQPPAQTVSNQQTPGQPPAMPQQRPGVAPIPTNDRQ